MKQVLTQLVLTLACLTPCAAGEPIKEVRTLGYDDTPLLPGSQWRVHDHRRPQSPIVEPGRQPNSPPTDAVILFDGKDLSAWEGGNPKGVADGAINILKTGELRSKRRFGDCQLHVEWMTPEKPDGDWLQWGNSGVLLMDQFEIQIFESHDLHPPADGDTGAIYWRMYADGNAGAIYGQSPPLVNASRKPGQWQTYDIVFRTPRFEGGKLIKPAYATVFQNGVLVQHHKEILGATQHKILPKYESTAQEGPIRLQLHGSAVKFRNIWVRPLKLDEP